jgi:hypothetical protein
MERKGKDRKKREEIKVGGKAEEEKEVKQTR